MDFILNSINNMTEFIADNDEIHKYLQQKADTQYLHQVKKNPDLFREKVIAMEDARLKMQNKYLLEAEEYQKKQELIEKVKQSERLERSSHINVGKKLGNETNEYNPLMGAGTSGGYRPPKRSCCGKK